MKEQNQKYKREINALRRSNTDDVDDDAEEDLDAGDQFGGKASKKGEGQTRHLTGRQLWSSSVEMG